MSNFIGSFAVAGGANSVLVSSYDIYDREFHKELYKTVPKHGALSWMRAVQDRIGKRKVDRNQYYYYEEQQHFKAAATIAAATNDGSNVLVTISTGDHSKAGKYSWGVLNQQVVFSDETVGFVSVVNKTSDNAHVFTIKPANASQAVQTAAVVGSKIVFFSNAQKERSKKTTPRVPEFKKIINYMQIIREEFEVTDVEEQQKIEFTVDGVAAFSYKGLNDTVENFKMQEDLAMLIGVASASLTDADGNPITTVAGLIPQVDAHGQTLEYYGTPDMTTLDDAMLILNKNYGDTEYIVGYGLPVSIKLKNWLIDFAKAGTGNVSFAAFGSDQALGQKQALNFNFRSIYMEPYTFHFDTWQILSHSDSLGADGLPYQDMMVFIPAGYTKVPKLVEGQNNYQPYMMQTYQEPKGNPSEIRGDYKIWETGANARKGATSDEMVREIHMIKYTALELLCRHKFLNVRKAS